MLKEFKASAMHVGAVRGGVKLGLSFLAGSFYHRSLIRACKKDGYALPEMRSSP